MKHHRIADMTGGWFVGDFVPSVIRTSHCEVAIKSYKKGDSELAHEHRIAVELTAIVSGRVRMLGREWGPGDIVTIEPGEVTDFLALTDTTTVVVKSPSVRGDKYLKT